MKALSLTIAAGLLLGSGAAAMADTPGKSAAKTPAGWSYEIKDGKRVPKAQRRTNADGSWKEESRQGGCVTVREKTGTGEYREIRAC